MLRLLTLGYPDITDPSEARYATVAQRMVMSGQWLVPEINRGEGFEPFWGKPPLHFWLTAASLKLFGFSEGAARLPSYLGSLLVVFFLFRFCAAFHSKSAGYLAGLISFSSFSFLVMTGASMTDMTLTVCTTGALVSFALGAVAERPSRGWGLAFYFLLALGFITKGPIAIVFPGAAIACWVLLTGNLRVLSKLPWISGAAIFIAVSAPWFIVAESVSPGINEYFFFNENYLRFTSRNYNDKYGSGHPVFRGVIWLYLAAGLMPWSVLIAWEWRRVWAELRDTLSMRFVDTNQRVILLMLIGALIPICFFTVARSVIFTYPVPSLPLCALCISCFLLRPGSGAPREEIKLSRFAGGFGVISTCAILLGFLIASHEINEHLSARDLIRYVRERGPESQLNFSQKLPYSALFYAQDNSGPTIEVGTIQDGEERRITCGFVAYRKESSDKEKPKFIEPKSVVTIHDWEVLQFKRCQKPL